MRTYSSRLRRHGAALWVLCGCVSSAWAADGIGAAASNGAPHVLDASEAAGLAHEAQFDFDIPAQALTGALKQYADATLQSTMFSSDIVAGKISSTVYGKYPAAAALQLLLAGTGLTVEKVGSGPAAAFILKERGNTAAAAARASPPSLAGYPALVQARIRDALCGDPRTVPGEYRMLLRFRMDADGRVQQPSLLNSTGDARRDAAVLETLRRVRVDATPPTDMPQPVTMLILPRGPGVAQCGAAGGAT